LNVFRRLELSGSLWRSRKDFFDHRDPKNALLASNYISFVHDNSLWVPVGPIDGWRLRVTAGQTFDFSGSRLHNYTVLVDNRVYLRLTRRLTFAQRTMFWHNDGTDIRRFYIGGSWGLRGYRITEVLGSKYVLLNQELRFPFAQSLLLNTQTFSLGMAPIRAALFLDVGNAWDFEFPGQLIGSYGFGLRGLFLGGLVLRLDMGRKTDFRSVDSDWFSQFFFGWDY
ncbi:MAG: BamA/TamA family outer membrane protein, partial [Candidatus Neomarinimicrobiota bacterium]